MFMRRARRTFMKSGPVTTWSGISSCAVLFRFPCVVVYMLKLITCEISTGVQRSNSSISKSKHLIQSRIE